MSNLSPHFSRSEFACQCGCGWGLHETEEPHIHIAITKEPL